MLLATRWSHHAGKRHQTGPYTTGQVVGLVVTLGLLTILLGWRGYAVTSFVVPTVLTLTWYLTRATGVCQWGLPCSALRIVSAVGVIGSVAECSCPAMRTVICWIGRRVWTSFLILSPVAACR